MAENERGHEQMGMQMGAASTSEYDHVVAVPYDSRNFLQVSIMQQPQHYSSHQLQPTTLQLG
jgi:MADS-box transcription factor, plant